jgi:hypothetical protein
MLKSEYHLTASIEVPRRRKVNRAFFLATIFDIVAVDHPN